MMICSTVLPQLSPFNKKYVLSFKKNSVYLEKLFANTSSHSEKKNYYYYIYGLIW